MGEPWGIGGFRGRRSPILSKSSKKTVKKSQKSAKSEKSDFFTWAELHKKGYFSELYPVYSSLNSIHLQLFCIRSLLHYFFI